MRVHMWRSEGNFLKLVLSFHHAGPEDRTRVLSLSSKCLYPLSCLDGPSSSQFSVSILETTTFLGAKVWIHLLGMLSQITARCLDNKPVALWFWMF